MSQSHNSIPIGKLLYNAGLISSEQLEQALQFQSQFTTMKLGEILVLQEIVLPQTIDFFVNRWQTLIQEQSQFPLGYYLNQAYLLTEQQIHTILQEQKSNQLRFGDLVVQKGWLKQNTIEFFWSNLMTKPPQLMSLIDLEKYNQQSLHLEKKYANASLIISRILAWTGGNPILTTSISRIFAESDLNIPAGGEMQAVDRLIENALIKNWRTSKLGIPLKSLQASLINNPRCEPRLLLNEYQDILLAGSKPNLQLKEQQELLNLGLIISDRDGLRVTNLIYQQVFNQNWLTNARSLIESKILESEPLPADNSRSNSSTTNAVEAIALTTNQNDSIAPIEATSIQSSLNLVELEPTATETIKNTEPLAKFSALITLAGITLLVPIALAINNYYSGQQQSSLTDNSTSKVDSLREFCNEIDFVDSQSALSLMYRLETDKQDLLRAFPRNLEAFPDHCEAVLNRLTVLAVPQLGKENRVIEAIKHLCKIPADSDSYNEAKVWIERWYASPTWRQETESYLNLVNNCPAGKIN